MASVAVNLAHLASLASSSPEWSSGDGTAGWWLPLACQADLAPLVRLRRETVRVAHLLLGDASTWELAVVSTLAGAGEEMLFRGVIQPVAVCLTTPLMGLLVASLLFGLAHCLTWLYFSFATLIGFYLGALALLCGEIVTPAVAHGLYDFVVLVHVLKLGRRLPT